MKTLFLDIETSPNLAMCWRAGPKVFIGHDYIIKERKIICISYKWAGKKENVYSLDWGNQKQCDKKLLGKISSVILDADEVVTHNGDMFDLKWINGRLLYHKLNPIGQVTSTDTLKLARRSFCLNSMKLDYISKFLGIGKKVDTGGIKLWKDILIDKDPKSLSKMIKYCEHDVILLEKVYNKLIKFGPKLHKGNIKESCKNCGNSKDRVKWGHYITTAGNKYQKYRCKQCNTVYRSPTKEGK